MNKHSQPEIQSSGSLPARQNPFASCHLDTLAFRFQSESKSSALSRLEKMDYRGAIVGPKGSGKTTLLEHLGGWLRQAGKQIMLTRIPHERSQQALAVEQIVRRSNDGAVGLVDGYERLSWRQRRILVKRTCRNTGLVITCHRPPPFPIWFKSEGDLHTLFHLLNSLNIPDSQELRSFAEHSFHRHHGNLRTVFSDFYLAYANAQLILKDEQTNEADTNGCIHQLELAELH